MANLDQCPVCGKKFGKLFGVQQTPEDLIKELKDKDAYTEGMCFDCAKAFFANEKQEKDKKYRELKTKIEREIPLLVGRITVCTTNVPEKYSSGVKGLVTGYSVIGTGPLSDFTSSITDIFGVESNSYKDKIKLAEQSAINSAKVDAIRLGGNSIYATRITVTEASSGHGMIMVAFSGTALHIPNGDEELDNLIKEVKEFDLIKKML